MPTDPSKYMTPDIYDLATYVNEVKKQFTDQVDEDTLMIGIYGMMGELFSNIAQNTIVMASEFANESIPTKAKFEKNIISHALNLNIDSFNAIPATMDVFLTFIEDEIIDAIGHDGTGEFKFDCDNKIYFDDFEFHPDYDIVIKRIRLSDGSYTYTAMYDMLGDDVYENPISDITNPYLTPPVVMSVNGTRYLFTACKLRQIEKKKIYDRILSDDTVTFKTATFSFESMLAGFTVDVEELDNHIHLVPIYEGLVNSESKYQYIWYTYLDSDKIRIKFDNNNSYSPRVNSDLEITLYTTQGAKGNFTWSSTDYPLFFFDSERNGYSNITTQVRPVTNQSLYGTDMMTIDELRRIIAIEALARGSITNTKDLQNYFNVLDTEYSHMYFYKKRDNALERLYYSYIVMKNDYANVIPTNTVDLRLDPTTLERPSENSTNLIFKRGQILKLNWGGTYAKLYDPGSLEPDYTNGFFYIIPYNMSINLEPMYVMYFLSTMNVNKNLEFTYINENCLYQYIGSYININRAYLTDPDTYYMTFSIEQNITDDEVMYTYDETTKEVTDSNVRVFLMMYDEDDNPYRWTEGYLTAFDNELKIATYQFKMTSDDIIDGNNNIHIEGIYQVKTDSMAVDYGYLPANGKAMIHIVTKTVPGQNDDDDPAIAKNKIFTDTNNVKINLAEYIPHISEDWGEDWCISNSYNIISGIDYFYDYSEIVYSTVSAVKSSSSDEDDSGDDSGSGSGSSTSDGYFIKMYLGDTIEPREKIGNTTGQSTGIYGTAVTTYRDPTKYYNTPKEAEPADNPMGYIYTIKDVPMVKFDYFKTEEMVESFCGELIKRKYYIDEALMRIEDSFGMNFKFFNTYGPSRLFTLDNETAYLDRVNISLKFRVALQPNYDENIIQYMTDDIKEFIDQINTIDSLHISNLITSITSKYKDSITFFEFLGINDYGPAKQHLFAMQMPDKVITPELINVHTLDDHSPDIEITIV